MATSSLELPCDMSTNAAPHNDITPSSPSRKRQRAREPVKAEVDNEHPVIYRRRVSQLMLECVFCKTTFEFPIAGHYRGVDPVLKVGRKWRVDFEPITACPINRVTRCRGYRGACVG